MFYDSSWEDMSKYQFISRLGSNNVPKKQFYPSLAYWTRERFGATYKSTDEELIT